MRVSCFSGIELGGTKLQFGVGSADGRLTTLKERRTVNSATGAEGIRRQIETIAAALIAEYDIAAIGIGFGGPVDASGGRTIKSHQVAGWDDFPLTSWARQTFGLPTSLANDSDMAGLGEARFGAGRGKKVVFYSNVGTGVGGALIINGRVYAGAGGIASELGHLRLGIHAVQPDATVESMVSGLAIAAAVQADANLVAEIRQQPMGATGQLTAKLVAEAADAGNEAALSILRRATQTYGWAVAQAITLLSPEVVIVGGGVSLTGETLFFAPLREEIERYVFPPLRGTYRIVPAELGEEMVVYGALALARELAEHGSTMDLFVLSRDWLGGERNE